jgi:hypothetical protein
MAEKPKKPASPSDDLVSRPMLPDKPPPRPRTEAKRIPLEKIEEMMGETKEGKKLPEKNLRKGGSVSSASKRADGCAIRGKTKGRFV